MAGGQVRKIWDKLLSPFRQVDKRQLQHEIDVHRIFLLTSYNRLGASGGEETADAIQSMANSLPFPAQQVEVQNNVHQQIASIAETLDNILLKTPRNSDVPPKVWRSGLSFAVGGGTPPPRVTETHPLSRAEVSAILQDRLGFTLECKPSGIQHEEAGEGLFLRGRVEPGTVVSMYPGVIYGPSQYRDMPGYPRVDRDNPYLISRYDGLIVDGKPWGRGGETRDWWDGVDVNETHELPQDVAFSLNAETAQRPNMNHSDNMVKDRHGLWESIAGPQQGYGPPIKSAVLERRNPLAFGHFANHPPKGTKPNVMICAYSVNAADEVVRPYIPNLVLGTVEEQMERQGLLWMKEGRDSRDYGYKVSNNSEIRTLVLIATRTIENEEVMLNYRLSSHIKTPAWFHSVDEEEDERRWE